jgi:hypothetical protein
VPAVVAAGLELDVVELIAATDDTTSGDEDLALALEDDPLADLEVAIVMVITGVPPTAVEFVKGEIEGTILVEKGMTVVVTLPIGQLVTVAGQAVMV